MPKPNFIVFLTDDQGYGDLSCMGATDFRTPHLDRLAADGVGRIMAEVERLGLADNTCTFFTADNGPSREARNWLDGTLDPYYGGRTGLLKGHKFSLYEGGIRVPGILHWPGRIPGKQVIHCPAASMDIFPTFLRAAGGDPAAFELDGCELLSCVTDGVPPPSREIFWEMGPQTAVRRGDWKLVLNGRLVEGASPEDDVHLANLAADLGERTNLCEAEPELTTELQQRATAWRRQLETRWEAEFANRLPAAVTQHTPDK